MLSLLTFPVYLFIPTAPRCAGGGYRGGFILFNSKDSTNESKVGDKSKPLFSLPVTVEKTYVNLHKPETINLIKKELSAKSGVYAFKHNPSNKMYVGSSIHL